MILAYYNTGCDSHKLFDDLKIAQCDSYEMHINKYNILSLDIASIASEVVPGELVKTIKGYIVEDIISIYPQIDVNLSFINKLGRFVDYSGKKFIAVIDEPENHLHPELQRTILPSLMKAFPKSYLNFLRLLFKSSGITNDLFAAAYMTGILPIKKDGSQSAISEFKEYTMIDPKQFAEFIGFTAEEVKELCDQESVDFSEMKRWYDGYSLNGFSIYNSNSVMSAVKEKKFESYWAASSIADNLLEYLNLDFDGLSDYVKMLIEGEPIDVNVRRFKNNVSSLASSDEVLTLLIHFGYLSWDEEGCIAKIPNKEIFEEFADTVTQMSDIETAKRVVKSRKLIKGLIDRNHELVAQIIEKIHGEESDPLHYNNEQALRAVLKLALFAHRDYYVEIDELPSGNGYADMVLIPRSKVSKPLIIIELKWDRSAGTALQQIKARDYANRFKNYGAKILLVGINYSIKTKKHSCEIEEYKDRDGGQQQT